MIRLMLTGPYVLLSNDLFGSSESPSSQTWLNGTIWDSRGQGSLVVTRSPGNAMTRLIAILSGFAGDLVRIRGYISIKRHHSRPRRKT